LKFFIVTDIGRNANERYDITSLHRGSFYSEALMTGAIMRYHSLRGFECNRDFSPTTHNPPESRPNTTAFFDFPVSQA
jgi:hypothetical protein